MSHLSAVTPPELGIESTRPEVPAHLYAERLKTARLRMEDDGLDGLVVYGDREHFANLQYLTGFDPRFEEALLLIGPRGAPTLLVGNECLGYLPDSSLGIDVELFQDFSLLGQPRSDSRRLEAILRDRGFGSGMRLGSVGWKYIDERLSGNPRTALEIPSYIADTLRALVGTRGAVLNATALFMDSESGLRITNEVEQIAAFEYAATVASTGIRRLLEHVEIGVREDALERHLDSRGLPLSCHRMVGFGEKAHRGLASASDNTAQAGDVYTTAFGVTGALTSRAGIVVRAAEELPTNLRDFYPKFVSNYFDVVASWYESVKVGASAGAVYETVNEVRDDELFTFALNPGHSIHLDEWVNSAFYRESDTVLSSGMALQLDIIPVSRGPVCASNAEDGIALADASLRRALEQKYPDVWARVQARRRFMQEELGIGLDDSVLPLSNTAGWLAPYALDLSMAMVRD